jgi:thiol-disulfide isomerase/thioredoxin
MHRSYNECDQKLGIVCSDSNASSRSGYSVITRVTEATFGRQVLRAALPVLACFGTRACPARRALLPALERVALRYAGQLLVAMVLVDDAQLLVEQYGVAASPTLMLFQGGDRQGQMVGFIADGLVDLLAEDVMLGAVAGDGLWSPLEERFEDVVLIPLLQRWGFTFQRQVACALAGKSQPQRGRIDLLVYAQPDALPLTLIESKRQIRGEQDLRQAQAQAVAYARALALPTFVIAAPRGLWVYRDDGARSVCVQHVTSLELHQTPDRTQQLLLQLGAGATARLKID